MIPRLLIPLLALALATPAFAEEKAATKDVGQYVDLSPVALPIVVDGRLVNYVFVSVRILLTSQANTPKLRAQEPFFRDALVRLGHRTPFTNAKDYQVVDTARLQAGLMREAAAIGGSDNIKGVVVVSQTPKKRVQPPGAQGRPGANEIHP
jgi:hypothetical protein